MHPSSRLTSWQLRCKSGSFIPMTLCQYLCRGKPHASASIFLFIYFLRSCSVENRFTGRQEGRKMGIGPSRIKSFHCKSLDPWFSDLPVSSVTDSARGKVYSGCLPASRAQSLMSVDAGLIEVLWHVCVCVWLCALVVYWCSHQGAEPETELLTGPELLPEVVQRISEHHRYSPPQMLQSPNWHILQCFSHNG